MLEFKYIQESSNLPDEWDMLADNYFQRKRFLLHSEKTGLGDERQDSHLALMANNNMFY